MSEIFEFPKPKVPANIPLVGRLLMLNVGIAPKFQCGGFSVNSGRLVDMVTERTQLIPISKALEAGILIDVSDNDVANKGFNLKNSSQSRVIEEDTDKKAFVGRDKFGRMFVVVPKDDEERAKFEEQIEKTGNIEFRPSEDEFTGFSPITEEELPEDISKEDAKS